MNARQTERLRALPGVDELLKSDAVQHWCQSASRADVTNALRASLDEARRRITDNGGGDEEVDRDTLLRMAETILSRETKPSLRPVINATGVVLHTGLGRAPLCDDAIDAIVRGASGYTNLEYDLDTGHRGRRQGHVSDLLCKLTGAEAATVVNNNAAAMLLIMRAICDGREVIVSRGQLVEIGGSFRMPEIMTAGGAVLREVGTTNRTRIADYRRAVTEDTAGLLRVHHSNFRIVGFTEEPTLEEIVACAHEHDLVAIDDLGSGAMFDLGRVGLPTEPHVGESVAAGFDLICFSGDKLLGGPQAGIIIGRADLVARIESHPLMRSYRLDKLVLLALEATLRRHTDPTAAIEHIPALAMLSATTGELAARARGLEKMLSDALPGEKFFVSSDTSVAGGGSMPGQDVETVVIRWRPTFAKVDEVIAQLRRGATPVVARIADDQVTFDLRTVREKDLQTLVAMVSAAQTT